MGSMTGLEDEVLARREGEALARRAYERLTLPEVPTTGSIIEHVAALRSREIRVTELASLAGTRTCGWWLAREDHDEILIAPPLSSAHRDALVLHEVGHLVLDLTGVVRPASDEAVAVPGAAPGVVAARRSHFTDATEIAAELLADALARAVRRGPRRLGGLLRVFT